MTAARRDDGFTLVELLVGLALLALMATLIGGAVSGVRQTQRGHDRQAVAASLEPAEAHLRRAIADMRPIRTGSATAPLIAATRRSVSFVSGHGPPGGYAGLHRLTLKLVPGGRDGVFDLEEVRALHRPAGAGEAVRRTVLVYGVVGLELRYFGAPGPRRPPTWSEDWTRPDRLPSLISIEILFAPPDGRRWAPLVVAPAAGF